MTDLWYALSKLLSICLFHPGASYFAELACLDRHSAGASQNSFEYLLITLLMTVPYMPSVPLHTCLGELSRRSCIYIVVATGRRMLILHIALLWCDGLYLCHSLHVLRRRLWNSQVRSRYLSNGCSTTRFDRQKYVELLAMHFEKLSGIVAKPTCQTLFPLSWLVSLVSMA